VIDPLIARRRAYLGSAGESDVTNEATAVRVRGSGCRSIWTARLLDFAAPYRETGFCIPGFRRTDLEARISLGVVLGLLESAQTGDPDRSRTWARACGGTPTVWPQECRQGHANVATEKIDVLIRSPWATGGGWLLGDMPMLATCLCPRSRHGPDVSVDERAAGDPWPGPRRD